MTNDSRSLVGGIETGGTKVVCAIGTGPNDLARTQFPTGHEPDQTLREVFKWFAGQQAHYGELRGIGIGSFGPLDLDRHSPTYGFIRTTTKTGWRETNLLGAVQRAMPGLPVAIDTDVNAAAIGEQRWGNGSGQENLVYVTMGTGIGAGLIAGGRIVHGLVHPEMGHMAIPRLPGDSFPGTCPWHGACWEGLCSGPALRERTGIPADQLPAIHEIWELAASYTAAALSNIVLVTSPHKIILGGSVAKAGELGSEGFLNLIRSRLQSLLNGYLSAPALILRIDSYVVGPGLGDNSGVCGALAMAQDAIHNTVDRAD